MKIESHKELQCGKISSPPSKPGDLKIKPRMQPIRQVREAPPAHGEADHDMHPAQHIKQKAFGDQE